MHADEEDRVRARAARPSCRAHGVGDTVTVRSAYLDGPRAQARSSRSMDDEQPAAASTASRSSSSCRTPESSPGSAGRRVHGGRDRRVGQVGRGRVHRLRRWLREVGIRHDGHRQIRVGHDGSGDVESGTIGGGTGFLITPPAYPSEIRGHPPRRPTTATSPEGGLSAARGVAVDAPGTTAPCPTRRAPRPHTAPQRRSPSTERPATGGSATRSSRTIGGWRWPWPAASTPAASRSRTSSRWLASDC